MEEQIDNRIGKIHSCGFKAAVVVTGGAVGAVHALLSQSGASRFVLEVQIPYSPQAMFDYLGEKLDQACSADAACSLAGRAFERALIFTLSSPEPISILGVACTAALQTSRDRRGDDRAFVCIKTRHREVSQKLVVPHASRSVQDEWLSNALLDIITDFITEDPA
jgi:hypothetical protein